MPKFRKDIKLFQYQVSFATVWLCSAEMPAYGYYYNCYHCPIKQNRIFLSLYNFALNMNYVFYI